MKRRNCPRPADRRGNVLVLSAVMMVVMVCLLAFAVDLGYISMARSELQRTADCAAMAAAWELIDAEYTTDPDLTSELTSARAVAANYAARNKVTAAAPQVDPNYANLEDGDVVVGYIANPQDSTSPMTYADLNSSNAVQVKVRKTATMNGEVPYFFARVLGLQSAATQATATAALLKNFSGFKIPSDGDNIEVLPFALDKDTWDDMLAGGGTDNWSYDETTGTISEGSDGVREVNLYPQGTGSPGNRGTVDVGSSNNSTNDISRQIVDGVNQSDMDALGKDFALDSNGKLYLNGDTGISDGVKDELASIMGKPRIIPVFDSVESPGNNATYTIVEFAGVRIVNVKLTGSNDTKRVIIQPAKMLIRGGLPANGAVNSHFIYSPVWLVR